MVSKRGVSNSSTPESGVTYEDNKGKKSKELVASVPSSIKSHVKAGGELTDFVIVLRTTKAVKTFGGTAHFLVGAGFSAAVGPIGRAAEADV